MDTPVSVRELIRAGVWAASVDFTDAYFHLLDMMAVFRTISSLLPHLQVMSIRLCTDNTTVTAYVNKQGGARPPTLSCRAEELLPF